MRSQQEEDGDIDHAGLVTSGWHPTSKLIQQLKEMLRNKHNGTQQITVPVVLKFHSKLTLACGISSPE